MSGNVYIVSSYSKLPQLKYELWKALDSYRTKKKTLLRSEKFYEIYKRQDDWNIYSEYSNLKVSSRMEIHFRRIIHRLYVKSEIYFWHLNPIWTRVFGVYMDWEGADLPLLGFGPMNIGSQIFVMYLRNRDIQGGGEDLPQSPCIEFIH